MHRRRPLPPALEATASSQARCLSRHQLREHGVDADAVRRRLRAGAWQTAGSSVVVLHAGPLGAAEHRWSAVLWSAPHGVLAGATALAVHGLHGWEREEVAVAVPRHASRGGPPWVRCRTTSLQDEGDVTERRGLPVHVVERAAVDAASLLPTARAAGGLVAAVVQQRLTTAERLLAAAERAPARRRHRGEVLSVLQDVLGGSQAMTEVDLVRLCRRYRLPQPERQVRREDARGLVRYLDAEWLRPDGTRLVLEVDGVGHLDEERWYDDLLRAAEVVTGDVVLRLPARALRTEPDRVAALLRRHLRAAVDPRRG
ncbi:hypothetical protein [uncultured Pseudokineococcus sp.]|uniref:hypothetical protein n=1 Tax=uncultured Pseudokineococcus sp. TaxID=1642928 RepID=UPI00260F793B|nr:hypothetical protein [uncultured Pseudokineococcus sp.]